MLSTGDLKERGAKPSLPADDLKEKAAKPSWPAGDLKEKAKPSWPAPRWVVAGVLAVLGLGALALHRRTHEARPDPWASAEPVEVSAAEAPADAEGGAQSQESLEDALKSLEVGSGETAAPHHADLGVFFSKVSDDVEVFEAHEASRSEGAKSQKTGKARKGSKASRKVVAPPPSGPEPREAKAKAAAAKSPKPAAHDQADDALKKLEGDADDKKKAKAILSDFVQRTFKSDAKSAEDIVGSAVKKSRDKASFGPSEASGKVSDEDKRKAKAIIQDTLKKLESSEGEDTAQNSELRDKLRALLGSDDDDEEEEEDASEEHAAKKARKKRSNAPEPEEDEEAKSHREFVKLLTEERERKHEHTLPKVKGEFKQEFGSDARQLLCSGCKLVSARLTDELSTHDVHDQDSPARMLAAKRRAIDATCTSLRHLHIVHGENGARFEAGEGSVGEQVASQRLCTALLEEYRFEMLTLMIQRKVPQASAYMRAAPATDNWERWMCANKARLCKRTEVREDDEDEGEL